MMVTDSEIIRVLETIYNAPLNKIAGLHPEEVEEDLTAFDDEALWLGAPTLSFTADEANAAIARAVGEAS